MKTYLNSLLSEWQKTRHSAASWIVLIGALFLPVVMIIVQVIYPEDYSPNYFADKYWIALFNDIWESSSLLLLPMGVVLCTSLITQLEFRNNTWKQVYATPQSLGTLFFAKLTAILLMLVQFFALHLVALLVAGYLPGWLNSAAGTPIVALPWGHYLYYLMLNFVAALPIVALQFLVAMRYKNFLVSVGFGIGMVIASMFALTWKHAPWLPYNQNSLVYFQLRGQTRVPEGMEIWWIPVIYFGVITAVHYLLYIAQKERGA